MQVLQINPISFFNNNQTNQSQHCPSFGLKMQKPLESDTVSFKGFRFDKVLEATAHSNNEKLKIPAKNFMAILQAIAIDLKDYGVSFNKSLCEPNSIKSPKSVVSKIKRSRTFKVPDRIRGTLYCKNIYDMSVLFKRILPALEEQGYFVADTEIALEEAMKRGYQPTPEEIKKGVVNYPDIDIRLNDEDYENPIRNIESIPDNMKYCIGKPQPSGYEDIQIRLEKTDGTKKTKKAKFWHELIILVGEEYDKTKHNESEHIYAYTRQFQELNLYNNEDSEKTVQLIKWCISRIKRIFSNEITQKVYENAKSKDLYGETEEYLPITLTEDDKSTLTKCYNKIMSLTEEYYKQKKKSKSDNEKAQNAIKREEKEDLERLGAIREGLTKAVDFYKNYNETSNNKKKKTKNNV